MNPRNIGIVFGPTLIKLKDDPASFFDNLPNDFVTFLIDNFEKVFDTKDIVPLREGSSNDDFEAKSPNVAVGTTGNYI